jgi:hypothetical protein
MKMMMIIMMMVMMMVMKMAVVVFTIPPYALFLISDIMENGLI